jgi:hypothetical protein
VRGLVLILVGCGSTAPLPPTPSNKAPAVEQCDVEPGAHALPVTGATVDETHFAAGWELSDSMGGKGVVAWTAVDEAAGVDVMVFVSSDHRYLGVIAPPAGYLLSVLQLCDDGFVIRGESERPKPLEYRRVRFVRGCTPGIWESKKPGC